MPDVEVTEHQHQNGDTYRVYRALEREPDTADTAIHTGDTICMLCEPTVPVLVARHPGLENDNALLRHNQRADEIERNNYG